MAAEAVIRRESLPASVEDIELIPVGTDGRGTPILSACPCPIGRQRRALPVWTARARRFGGNRGSMRAGENALAVIELDQRRLKDITPGSAEVRPHRANLLSVLSHSSGHCRAPREARGGEHHPSPVSVFFLFHLRSALVADSHPCPWPCCSPASRWRTFTHVAAIIRSVALPLLSRDWTQHRHGDNGA